MDGMNIIDLARQAGLSTGILVAPILIVALAVGVLMSVLQAVTQVQDHAISFIPKLLAIGCVLLLFMPWMTEPEPRNMSALKNACVIMWNSAAT